MIFLFKAVHYCYLIYLKIFENICLEIYDLDPAKFVSPPGLAWQAALKKTKVKLDI